MINLNITEHTDRPGLVSSLSLKLGIQFRVFQELSLNLPQGHKQNDIYIFRSDKISRISEDEISYDENNDGLVAIIETKHHQEKDLEKHNSQLKGYARRLKTKLGFITNYKNIRFYHFDSDYSIKASDVYRSDNTEDLTDYIASKIEEKTKITIGYDADEIISYLEKAVDDLMIYTERVNADIWEHILRLSDESEKDTKKREMSPEERLERDLFFQRSAAYVGIAQIVFYIVFRNYLIGERLSNADEDAPKLRPLSLANGIPTQIQEIIQDVPKNNLDFKAIFGAHKDIFSQLDDDASGVIQGIVKQCEGISANFVIENDLIGQIFQRLMPYTIRKKFAAFYTRSKAAELLCELAIQDKNAIVYDPACGSGTLLVKAYQRKKELGLKQHNKLLEQIKGSDISDIAAMMTTIHLAIQDPGKWTNEVNIYPHDAFSPVSGLGRYDNHSQLTPDGLQTVSPIFSGEKDSRVGVLLGNPPFTKGSRLTLDTRDILKNLTIVKKYNIRCDFKRINLYAFFLLSASYWVKKEKGIVAFILPIGAINSDIMTDVWQALFKENFGIKYLIEASYIDESFSESQEQEIIVIMERNYTDDARIVKLFGSLESKDIHQLVTKLQKAKNTQRTEDFVIHIKSQKELQTTPCIQWKTNPSDILILLYQNYIPLNINELYEDEKAKYSEDLTQFITLITENASRPVDYWFIPNKFWEIEKFDKEKFYLTATSANTVISSNYRKKRSLTLPRTIFIPAMSRELNVYYQFPPIIPQNTIDTFYLTTEHVFSDDFRLYNEWGKRAHEEKLFGESHSSFTPVKNAIGIIKKLDFSSTKSIALRFLTPMMGTRIITVGFKGNNEIDINLFFAYLTSSLFLLDVLEKARSRRGEFVIIYQMDLNKIYRFPNFNKIKENKKGMEDLLKLSNDYNNTVPIKDRPNFLNLIITARTEKEHPLRKLDEAWFEILNIPIPFLDSFYREIEDRLKDINLEETKKSDKTSEVSFRKKSKVRIPDEDQVSRKPWIKQRTLSDNF